MKKIVKLFQNIWYYRTIKRTKKIEGLLQAAVAKQDMDREVERIILKYKITKHVHRYLGVKAVSDFIPVKGKSIHKCIVEVHGRFGDKMEKAGIVLKADLTLCNTP